MYYCLYFMKIYGCYVFATKQKVYLCDFRFVLNNNQTYISFIPNPANPTFAVNTYIKNCAQIPRGSHIKVHFISKQQYSRCCGELKSRHLENPDASRKRWVILGACVQRKHKVKLWKVTRRHLYKNPLYSAPVKFFVILVTVFWSNFLSPSIS